jgi:hypothetical protein
MEPIPGAANFVISLIILECGQSPPQMVMDYVQIENGGTRVSKYCIYGAYVHSISF